MATNLIARITNNNGRLSATTPITLKNQIQEIRSIEDIADVAEINVAEGATLVYNSTNDKYEVRQLTFDELSGDVILDGGTF